MSRRYHINPKTGVPSICRAEKGNCPYGGETGEENHFATYSEAQKRSQEIFKESYQILPSNNDDEIMREIEFRKKSSSSKFDSIPKGNNFETYKAIMNTKDENVIMGIIEGEVYDYKDWPHISIALQNPNIPKDFLNEAMFEYPEDFEDDTRRWLVMNPALTNKQLISIIENKDEDMTVRALAFRNPNLSDKVINHVIEKYPEALKVLPYSMILYSDKSTPETNMLKTEALVMGGEEYRGINAAQEISMSYSPWHIKFRKELEEEGL